jgi:hypothetical protein
MIIISKIIPKPVKLRNISSPIQTQRVSLAAIKIDSTPSTTNLDRLTTPSRYQKSPVEFAREYLKNKDWITFSFELLIGGERVKFEHSELIPKHRQMAVGKTISADVKFRIEPHKGNNLNIIIDSIRLVY